MVAPVKVLIVDDSAFSRVSIGKMLEKTPAIQVVGYAVNGEEGLRKLLELQPDVVTLDLEMPRMGGFGLLRLITQNNPVPVIVVSSQNQRQDVFKALELGAIDFIAKPARAKSSDLYSIEQDLTLKVLEAARLKGKKLLRHISAGSLTTNEPVKLARPINYRSEVLLIGASTGGPPALHQLFSAIKDKLPIPVAVAQHMPPGFTQSFANRLNDNSPMHVKEAEDGDRMLPGQVLICPGSKNMELEEAAGLARVRIVDPPEVQIYTPSVDVLFRTGAQVYGGSALGVVMTGMGNDGASGTRSIVDAGGRVLAEAEETCVVYGMPKEAYLTGKVEKSVPLPQLLAEIELRCRPRRPVS